MRLSRILWPTFVALLISLPSTAQDYWQGKFEQLEQTLPTPNEYRTGAGAPGEAYWQQKADYDIKVEIDDNTQMLLGSETITYHNRSQNTLEYLWVQLDQNVRENGNLEDLTKTFEVKDSMSAKGFAKRIGYRGDYVGGFNIKAVKAADGFALPFVINRTMMRIDIPQPLKPGSQYTFSIDWDYHIYDRMIENGRGGYEYFPADGNYSYTCAQWYPRMAVYDDVNGWQNKQFIGNGEFALTFGNFNVSITVPKDHIVGATGELQNPVEVLTKEQYNRFERAKSSFEAPVFIVDEAEAISREKQKATSKSTWKFYAENVRDFAFCSSRKYIWEAMAVKLPSTQPLAMAIYPKEGNPLWEKEGILAVKNTLEVYSKRTFDYPYPVAIAVHAANVGMEYPMICFNFGRPSEDGKYSNRLREGMISVVVHEVGHNFFPMIVNSDERQWTWMDEGLNTFLEKETTKERYPDIENNWGTPKGMTYYMKGDKSNIRPIMTNSEQVTQFGNNAYGKPAAALSLLRETVMGPELFDYAFKEYANRWAFKHPKPADFFRTMEDASAIDLDWFWKGWFYSVDHVDVSIDDVKWFKLKGDVDHLEEKAKPDDQKELSSENQSGKQESDFNNGYETLSLSSTSKKQYREFMNRIDEKSIHTKLANKNIYEVTLTNVGGLITPLIFHFTFEDGSEETQTIPAEIWRYNEIQAKKVFAFDKEVTQVTLDPEEKTGDTDINNNTFPKREVLSKFERFKAEKLADKAKASAAKPKGEWDYTIETSRGNSFGNMEIKKKKGKYQGTIFLQFTNKNHEIKNAQLKDNLFTFDFETDAGGQNIKITVEMIITDDTFFGEMEIVNFGAFEIIGKRK